jgi:alkanesulfonate monooxygenase SsuD/methylene tetrahydromethanopterin reductase-like flavin-dependent oxidoreductase (luciferase family)
MSGGRVLLGIGVGWLKEEFDAIGVPFTDRGRRTDEYIAAMRALWSQDVPSYHGDYVSFTDAFMRPKPTHGSVPIIIGGQTPPAARRAGRLAQGFFPGRGVPLELIDLVRQTAIEHGRDPAEVEITVSVPDDLSELPRLAGLGVTRVLVPVTGVAGLRGTIRGPDDVLAWRDAIERYAGV